MHHYIYYCIEEIISVEDVIFCCLINVSNRNCFARVFEKTRITKNPINICKIMKAIAIVCTINGMIRDIVCFVKTRQHWVGSRTKDVSIQNAAKSGICEVIALDVGKYKYSDAGATDAYF